MSSTRQRPKGRRWWQVGAAAAIAVVLAGCGSTSASTAGDTTTPAVSTSSAAASGSDITRASPVSPDASTSMSAGASGAPTGPVTATDPKGATVTLPHRPERIVCLTGLCDDVLFTLGLTPVGTSTPDLLALDSYLGAAAKQIPVIPGGFGTEDIESIAALKPDLVIGLAGVHDQNKAAIENFAPLIVVDVLSYRDSLAYQTFLGELTGHTAQAAAGNADFEKAHQAALALGKEKNLKSTVALSMYWNVGTTGVNTDDDIIGSLLAEVFSYPWPNKGGDWSTQAAYSNSEILKQNPQVIFMQSYTATPSSPKGSAELAKDPLWQRISAVKDGKVMEVQVALWTAGRGPHALAQVLTQAAEYAAG